MNDNNDSDNYNPNDAYNYDMAHKEQTFDKGGHPVPPPKKGAGKLATAAFILSLTGPLLCCCSPYVGILCGVMGITLSICSKYFNNEERRFHPLAVAALVISIITLILILGMIAINYILIPYLLDTYPEFKEYYNQMYENLNNMMSSYSASE